MEQIENALGLPCGIHRGVPESTYHQPKMGVVSKSALDAVNRSPLHYLTWLHSPSEDTPALRFGRAFHCAALEPDTFAQRYVVEPDFGDLRSSKNREKRDAWREQNAHVTALAVDDWTAIQSMTAALRSHRLVREMLQGGDSELTVTWRDPETGLPCKSRADYYVERLGLVVDLKTTQDAGIDAFRKSISTYRYHVQDALYRDAFAQAGKPIKHFMLVAVEKSTPHGVAVYTLDADGIARGYNAARTNINQLAEAVRTDAWTGYPEHINTIDLPPWAA